MAYIYKSYALKLVKAFETKKDYTVADIHGLLPDSMITLNALSDGSMYAQIILDHGYGNLDEFMAYSIRNLTDVSVVGDHLRLLGESFMKIPLKCDYAYLKNA